MLSISDIFEFLKTAGTVFKGANKLDEYAKILETQEKLLEMQNRINALEVENSELKNKLEIKSELSYEKNSYWRTEEGKDKDGPYCSCCWDDTKKLIRISHTHGGYYGCPKCKNSSNVELRREVRNNKVVSDDYT